MNELKNTTKNYKEFKVWLKQNLDKNGELSHIYIHNCHFIGLSDGDIWVEFKNGLDKLCGYKCRKFVNVENNVFEGSKI